MAHAAAPATVEPGPDARIERLSSTIEGAFRHCDSSLLKRCFSPRVKTFLSSRSLGVHQGYYGADQVLLILQRGFAGRSTLRFRLAQPDERAPQPGRRVLPSLWRFMDEGTAKSEVRLSFTLAPEGGAWYIREIRETP